MKRAKLVTDQVTNILITATMTHPDAVVTHESLLQARRAEGYFDEGYHYHVGLAGESHSGVPYEERGSMFGRYAHNTIVIQVAGGILANGSVAGSTLTKPQAKKLKALVEAMQRVYPNALPIMHRDLFKGMNPCFDTEDYLT